MLGAGEGRPRASSATMTGSMPPPPAAIKLTLTIAGGAPRVIEAGPVALVGSGRGADVRIPDPALAPLHLRLARAGDGITALAAVAGVEVDGRPLAVDEPLEVAGRTVAIGAIALVAVPWQPGRWPADGANQPWN